MKVTLPFLIEKFEEYNHLCFNAELPRITLRVSNSRRALGMFRFPRIHKPSSPRALSLCSISVSACIDLPQTDIEDTLIHEMIHFYIWYRRIKDTSSHGEVFKRMMNNINLTHGRNITISQKLTQTQSESDQRSRLHYICVTRLKNGELGITICATTSVFDIHDRFANYSPVISQEWYASYSKWFNKFPHVRTPKIYRLSEKEYNEHVKNEQPMMFNGNYFRIKS